MATIVHYPGLFPELALEITASILQCLSPNTSGELRLPPMRFQERHQVRSQFFQTSQAPVGDDKDEEGGRRISGDFDPLAAMVVVCSSGLPGPTSLIDQSKKDDP